jgi:predicted amidohydrolase YtcJ
VGQAVVLSGGTVFTGHGVRSRSASVAVRDGRIVAVGDESGAVAAAGPDAHRVDVAGGLVTPGFQDAHVHPVSAGLQLLQCDLTGYTTADQCVDAVARYAAAHPERAWITGGGWAMPVFPGGLPTRDRLDAVVADRPVYLPNADGHGAWVNSAALARAGIDGHTPDPPDGRIERDAAGEPTGMLHEGAATLVGRLVPPATPADLDAALLAGQQHLFSFGITAWQDAIVGNYLGGEDNLAAYLRAAASGALRARVVGALWWDRDRGAEQVADLVERRAGGRVGRFAATTVKIMQDGVVENFTAGLTEPYLDACGHATTNAGLSFVDPRALREHVTRLDAAGFQVHFHALGDRAVREALDAVEAARVANGPGDHRHHLAHLQVVHPDDVARFAVLGAAANLQPLWACHDPQMDELTIPFLGPRRAGWQYPFGDLHRAGARLAAGSDWSVSSPDPLWGAHVAVNRTGPGGADGTAERFLPDQALDLATILTAYTAGSAYVNHLDHRTGTIEVGRDADLAVLDRDPFDRPAADIGQARVVRTYVQGDLVYDATVNGRAAGR